MKRFAELYRKLDRSTATLDKRAALVDYFRNAPPHDAAWALWLLSGGKATGAKAAKVANTRELREWIVEESGTPAWLVDDSYDQVGDLAETLALLLDDPTTPGDDISLSDWIERRLLPVAGKDVALRRAVVVDAWRSLPFDQRLLFNKLLTGALRVGVSQRLVQQALAEMSGIEITRLAQRMLGTWTPTPQFLADLLTPGELAADRQQPYPFFLASPLEAEPSTLGDIGGLAAGMEVGRHPPATHPPRWRGGAVVARRRAARRSLPRDRNGCGDAAARLRARRRIAGVARRRSGSAAFHRIADAHPAPQAGREDARRHAGARAGLRPARTRWRGLARIVRRPNAAPRSKR